MKVARSVSRYNCDQSENDNNTPPGINNNIVVLGDSIPKGINNSEFEYST